MLSGLAAPRRQASGHTCEGLLGLGEPLGWLWGIFLIGVVEMGRPAHCGRRYSVGIQNGDWSVHWYSPHSPPQAWM